MTTTKLSPEVVKYFANELKDNEMVKTLAMSLNMFHGKSMLSQSTSKTVCIIAIKMLILGANVVSLLLNSVGMDVVALILAYLDLEDLVCLETVLKLMGHSIMDHVKGTTASAKRLQQRIAETNHFKIIFKASNCRFFKIDYDRFFNLSLPEMLQECRMLSHPVADGVAFFDFINLVLPESQPVVAFNPVHDIIAIANGTYFLVYCYGGKARKQGGAIIYLDNGRIPPPIRCSGIAGLGTKPSIQTLSWSPLGTHLLVTVQHKSTDNSYGPQKAVVYKYFADRFTLRKCVAANFELVANSCMLTSNLWLTDRLFLWPTISKTMLAVEITKRNEISVIKLINNTDNIFDTTAFSKAVNLELEMRSSERAQSLADTELNWLLTVGKESNPTVELKENYGNFFASPSTSEYFCILRCPVHYTYHDCIGIISPQSKIQKLIYIPGIVSEIKVLGNKVFVLYNKFIDLKYGDSIVNTRDAAVDASNYRGCSYLVLTANFNFDKYLTKVGYFTTTDYQFKDLTDGCCYRLPELETPTTAHTQRDLFSARHESNFMYPTKWFVQLSVVGYELHELVHLGKTFNRNIKIYIDHHHSHQIIKEPTQPIYIFNHPTKHLVFIYPAHDPIKNFASFMLTHAASYEDLFQYLSANLKSFPFDYNSTMTCALKNAPEESATLPITEN